MDTPHRVNSMLEHRFRGAPITTHARACLPARIAWKDRGGSGPSRRTVKNRKIILWSIGPCDLLVGVLFGLVAHLGMHSTRPPDTVACIGGAHGWSAYERVAGISSPRGLPCGPAPRGARDPDADHARVTAVAFDTAGTRLGELLLLALTDE